MVKCREAKCVDHKSQCRENVGATIMVSFDSCSIQPFFFYYSEGREGEEIQEVKGKMLEQILPI